MDILKDILKEKGSELAGGLVGKLGFSAEQAQAFVPEAAASIFDVVKEKGAALDLSDPASSASSLVDGVDAGALADKVGIDSSQATSGLGAIVPILLSALQEKAGGLSGLTSMLGGEGLDKALGGASAISGAAGKLFGR